MEGFFLRLYRIISKRREIFLIFLLLAGIAVAFYASGIRFEEDISKSIPGENEQIINIVNNSRLTNKLIIRIFFPDSVMVTDTLISYADRLTDSLGSIVFAPYIEQSSFKVEETAMQDVMDLFYNQTPVFLTEEDYQKIDTLIQPENIEKAVKNTLDNLISPAGFALKEYLMKDPLGIGSLALAKLRQFQIEEGYEILDGYIFANNKTSLLLFIDPLNPPSETRENTIFINRLDRLIRYMNNVHGGNVKAEYYGSSAVAVGNAKQIKKDIAFTFTMAMFIIMLFIGWYFRKASIPFISFLPAVFGGISALALIFLIKGSMSVIALGIGSVLLGIIVDYPLYLYSLYKTKGSIETVIRDMSRSIIICAVTSATAFFSLWFVKSEVLKDLGLFAGFSILGAALFSLAVLPQLVRFPKDQIPGKENPVNRIASFDFEKSSAFILIVVIATILFSFFYKKAGFESDMYSISYMSPELTVAEKNLSNIGDITSKSITLVSTGTSLDEALNSNEKILQKLSDLKHTGTIRSYSNAGGILVSDSVQAERIRRWKEYWSEEKIKMLKASMIKSGSKYGFTRDAFNGFFSTLGASYHPLKIEDFEPVRQLFLKDMVSISGNFAMVVSLVKVDSDKRSAVYNEFKDDTNCVVIDRLAITTNMVAAVREDFDKLVKMCLLFVTLVLIIAFGRLETGLISAIPMFISWLWTLGFMGLTGIQFNIINIIVSTFVFGLGVDYSILMMQGQLLEFKYGQKEMPSYRTSVFLSAFTTLVGIGALILAKHPSLHSISLISVFGVTSVVLISYTIEPLLFKGLINKRKQRRKLPMTLSDIAATFLAFGLFIIGCLLLHVELLVLAVLPLSGIKKRAIMHASVSFWCKVPVYAMVHIKKNIINIGNEDFSKPAVILSNHQSHIDLVLLLMLHPKMIVLTTTWVWNNPLYSLVIRYLGYYPVTGGYEELAEKLKTKTNEGYSVLVFPEGSRSPDSTIKRFHKGAFLIAENLGLDILPVIIHGAGDCMNKGENHLRGGSVTIKIYPRIKAEDKSFDEDYHKKTKFMLAFYRKEYARLKGELETPDYFRKKVIRNYIYKGPVLEWYLRIKLMLEDNYNLINSCIPSEAYIVDIGCGYGYLAYMLSFISEKRRLLGIDYDADKISIAGHCISKNDRIQFFHADVTEYPLGHADIYILSDVLHYLTNEQQEKLLVKCIENLNPGGKIIIRDADSDLLTRHRRTRFTEFFSTRSGFNKTGEQRLFFFSGKKIQDFAERYGMTTEIFDHSKFTSNKLFVLAR